MGESGGWCRELDGLAPSGVAGDFSLLHYNTSPFSGCTSGSPRFSISSQVSARKNTDDFHFCTGM